MPGLEHAMWAGTHSICFAQPASGELCSRVTSGSAWFTPVSRASTLRRLRACSIPP